MSALLPERLVTPLPTDPDAKPRTPRRSWSARSTPCRSAASELPAEDRLLRVHQAVAVERGPPGAELVADPALDGPAALQGSDEAHPVGRAGATGQRDRTAELVRTVALVAPAVTG